MNHTILSIKSKLKRLPLLARIFNKAQANPREAKIMRYITKEMTGLEIAPYFTPLAPKKEGYNCKILDVFNQETLIKRAISDPNIPDSTIENIEAVDILGSASDLWELLSPHIDHHSLDYIVSSHNFEHIPNPVKFLKGCERALSHSGVLSMAIPDLRCCFDYFRWPTTLTKFLESYHESKIKPNPFDVFDGDFSQTNNFGRLDFPREQIKIIHSLSAIYDKLKGTSNNQQIAEAL